jgi:hypothetical protein
MRIMNIVWPVTALYSGPLGLWAYYAIGRENVKDGNSRPAMGQMHNPGQSKPSWQSVLKGSLHCGSGCTIGDLLAEVFIWFIPVAIAGSPLAGSWVIDYGFAFTIGIIFQYYAIRPMKKGSTGQIVLAALKADALSLTCWQIGMYTWMAICFFSIFHQVLKAGDPVYWFMMQIAMLIGLLTACPVNWWLLRKGIKEAM